MLRLGLTLAISVAVGLLGFEGLLRFALFGDGSVAHRLGRDIRNPGRFADRRADSYWKLKSALLREQRRPVPGFHPQLGWCGSRIDPETLAHPDFDPSDPRRLVLLYGDSFARCATRQENCWEALLARSELGDRFVCLNYGVSGYGLDQAYLLFRATIELYQERDPIVIASTLVDDDLARTMLSMRSWPKPRLAVSSAGELTQVGPAPLEDFDLYLAEQGTGIRSYLASYLVHGTKLLPSGIKADLLGERELDEETRLLNGRILEAWHAELEERSLDSFFLLFHGKDNFRPRAPLPWEHWFLVQTLERLRWPYQSSIDFIREDSRRTRRKLSEYYKTKGAGLNHYTPLGNEVVFEAILAGLQPHLEDAR